MQRVEKKVKVVKLEKYEKRKELLTLASNCNSCFQVVIQKKDGSFYEVKGFRLDEDKKIVSLSDGTKILKKGWVHIARFENNHFHLFPMRENFGFCYGINGDSVLKRNICNQLINILTEIHYNILDEDNGIFYEVTEFFIEGDPFSIDIFSGQKNFAIFQGNKELGLFYNGDFYETTEKNLKVHPISRYILNNFS